MEKHENMDDKILELARQNSNRGKEYDNAIVLRGDNIAVIAGALLGIIIVIIKLFAYKEFDLGMCTVLFAITGIQFANIGIRLRKIPSICLGVFESVMAVITLVLFLMGVFA